MRFLLKVEIPMQAGNKVIKSGELGDLIQRVLGEIKPEAAYFTLVGGERGAYFVVDMQDASQIPAIMEPIFLGLDATVECVPVMTPDDLQKAGPAIERAVQTYG